MAKITYIHHSGEKKIIEVENGLSVMEGAIQNNVPGIDADCGGSMACATCHVYVDEKWFNKLAFGLVIWAAAIQNTSLAKR